MYFINNHYFINDIFIPNLKVNNCTPNLSLFGYMTEYEKECLRLILGECMFDELIENIEWNTQNQKYQLKASAEEKWHWLLFGHTYEAETINKSYKGCGCGCQEFKCNKYKWEGLLITENHNIDNNTMIKYDKSLIAHYIYYKWALNEQTKTTGIGEQVLDIKGGVNHSANNHFKAINSYNKFVAMTTNCSKNGRVGLYTFVKHNADLYPNFSGTCLKFKNLI